MKVICAALAAITALCFCMTTSSLACYSAEAESVGVYARADVTDAYLCSDADYSCALFAIPYTYCVRVISENGLWYYVSYAADSGAYRIVYGYVLKSKLTVLDGTPTKEWLYYTVTVTYSQGTSGYLPTLDDITATAAFYGNYYSGLSGYSYVLCQGSFGYIMGATEDYDIVEEETSEEEPAEKQEAADGKIVAAVVLGVLAFITVALVFLSGRGKYKKG